ncbi:MAG: hypothetical protein V7K21_14895 [Nostoc sp.]|uniref:hypothetical protein n=1 Tax=Nostoc sp. TaxID=1180 RepID=UPI002FFD4B3C
MSSGCLSSLPITKNFNYRYQTPEEVNAQQQQQLEQTQQQLQELLARLQQGIEPNLL